MKRISANALHPETKTSARLPAQRQISAPDFQAARELQKRVIARRELRALKQRLISALRF